MTNIETQRLELEKMYWDVDLRMWVIRGKNVDGEPEEVIAKTLKQAKGLFERFGRLSPEAYCPTGNIVL